MTRRATPRDPTPRPSTPALHTSPRCEKCSSGAGLDIPGILPHGRKCHCMDAAWMLHGCCMDVACMPHECCMMSPLSPHVGGRSRRTIEERIAKQSVFEEPIAFANRRPGLGVGTTIASRGGRRFIPFPTSVSRGAFVGCRAVPLMLGERSAADALRHTHTRRPRTLVGPGLPFSLSDATSAPPTERGMCS